MEGKELNLDSKVVGRKIKEIRKMTAQECHSEGWQEEANYPGRRPYCIALTGGTIIYPSRDYEGNGAGAFFGCTKVDGKPHHFAI
jgi:hypothetical protein